MNDLLRVRGIARVRLWGPREEREPVAKPAWWPKGTPLLQVEREETVSNLITTGGLGYITDQLADTPVLAALSHMELGRDGTPPEESDIVVKNPIAGSRLALTNVPAQSGATLTYLTFWDRGVATDPVVAEAGDFNSAAGGTMIARIVFGPFDKTADHILSIERIWTFSNT